MDPDVLLVAANLPPPISEIKRRVKLQRPQKDAMMANKNPTDFWKRMIHQEKTIGFPTAGLCSTADLWDGNVCDKSLLALGQLSFHQPVWAVCLFCIVSSVPHVPHNNEATGVYRLVRTSKGL